MTKKNVLWISVGSILFFLSLIFLLESHTCSREWMWCRKYIWDSSNLILRLLLLAPFLFFFSLLTYRMRDEAFRAWWNPARLWIPVIIIATLITSVIDSQRGSNIGDFPISPFVLGTLYLLFVSSSLWNILRVYRRSKGK